MGLPLKGHEGAVYSVAYSPDNQRVVSGSGDMTVRVWDVTSGETVIVLRGHSFKRGSFSHVLEQRKIYSVGLFQR